MQERPTVPGQPRAKRDPRIDLLRGFALVTIFIDHIPGNPLNLVTLRNFGFADAAELFVILAGISSMTAYGGCFEREGAHSGLRRVTRRCLRLYLFQIGLLLTTLAIVHQWRMSFGLEPRDLAPFFDDPWTTLGRALALHALPADLNILPLYIVLLGAFPLIYAGLRFVPGLAVLLSGSIWALANLDHEFNLKNWLDGQGWFFNPFAWQFLFTLGAVGAMALRAGGGDLPRRRLWVAASWAYLAVALVLAAPWSAWGLSEWHLIALAPSDKTNLAPERLFNMVAILYLALSSSALRRVAANPWAASLVACGKHSLEVFSFATILALVFRLLFHTYGASLLLDAAANILGVGAMVLLAQWLERRQRLAARGTPAVALSLPHPGHSS
jgi:hypothetical protein